MATRYSADLLDRAAATVGEGPQWDARNQTLSWVDITSGLVHVTTESGSRLASHDAGQHVGAALPTAQGGWLLATSTGFSLLATTGQLTPYLDLGLDPAIRLNDSKCDPRGRAFVGTMAYAETQGAAALYRLDAGPTATTVFDGLTISNGMAWTNDGGTFWFIDSPTQSIVAYDYDVDDGQVGRHRRVIHVSENVGMPDGLCIDDDGCLWVGLFGGGAVHRYTPTGRLDTVIDLPVDQVTSCAFGGTDYHTLFITTASHHLTPSQRTDQPLAGGLFAVRLPQSGPPATPWIAPLPDVRERSS